MIGSDEFDPAGAIHRGARLREDAAVDRHLAGENHRARALARGGEPTLDYEDIQSLLVFRHRVILNAEFRILTRYRPASVLSGQHPVCNRRQRTPIEPGLDEAG